MSILIMTAIALYMAYSTWKLARTAWKEGNKFAAAVFVLMSASFPVIVYFIQRIKS